ncbi:MAG: amidase [Candidatus Omnitrophica bacterium]|nr:amidase [Candidatus Omnitrophota bacterium]
MSAREPYLLSATDAIGQIRAGELTAKELVASCISRIERLDPSLKAWAFLAPELAKRAAAAVDGVIHEGGDAGLLGGIPIGIKDIFNTYDMPTGMGSPLWSGYTPGNDARVVSAIRLAGGIVMGKTVTAEFAVHHPGPTVNPYDGERTPGTSSSGSAVAVAASMVPLALGSQTAGSTIRPASYCGVYGCKPSFGLLPRTGSLKTTDTLDTVSWFARTIDDIALLFDVLRVQGTDYPFSGEVEQAFAMRGNATPWRIGLVRGPTWQDAESYARTALLAYAEQLAGDHDIVVEDAALPPDFDEAYAAHETIYDKALSYYFKQEYGQREHLSWRLQAMIRHGQQITLDQYHGALARQAALTQAFDQWMQARRLDALLTLSTGGEAMRGLEAPDRPDTCLIWTLCGAPVISAPVFHGPSGLPFGAQFVARRYADAVLLRLCRLLSERALIPEAMAAELSAYLPTGINAQ